MCAWLTLVGIGIKQFTTEFITSHAAVCYPRLISTIPHCQPVC